MASIPKVDYLRNSVYYSYKKTSQKKKMLNAKRIDSFAIGKYIDNLCSVSLNTRIDYLNKMVDAKFKPASLKNFVNKTLSGLVDVEC